MTIYVFTGPTLSPDDARSELEAVYLPPVSQGDVYRIGRRQPRAIGIIDGYFERAPAVWHKEILWAMTQGIHVYGSASLGALRAAELAAFGMEGVGRIFESLRDGLLEDDDEVTVVHGDADSGFRPSSEAMLNIRATLARAEAVGVLGASARTALERAAKDLFYPERTYPQILQKVTAQDLNLAELDAFTDWLPHGRVDQKRQDALAMLRAMREHLTNPEPKRVSFALEHTTYWDQLIHQAGTVQLVEDDAQTSARTVLLDELLDELRLQGTAHARARQGAMLLYLAVQAVQDCAKGISDDMAEKVTDKFVRARGLLTEDDVSRWLEENDLTNEEFGELMRQEALLGWAEALMRSEVTRSLPNYLRLSGEYTHLRARALDKQKILEFAGMQNPSFEALGLTAEALLKWHFDRLGRPVEPDVAKYARAAGFADRYAFLRAVLREFCYIHFKEAASRAT